MVRSLARLALTAIPLAAACAAPRPEQADSETLLPPSTATAPALVRITAGPPSSVIEIVGASHVLVAFEGAEASSSTRSKEQARRRAEEVRAKCATPPVDFAEIARTYTDDDATRSTGGALGNIQRWAMPEPFTDAAFALRVGEVSTVVETPRGFHVILRTR